MTGVEYIEKITYAVRLLTLKSIVVMHSFQTVYVLICLLNSFNYFYSLNTPETMNVTENNFKGKLKNLTSLVENYYFVLIKRVYNQALNNFKNKQYAR